MPSRSLSPSLPVPGHRVSQAPRHMVLVADPFAAREKARMLRRTVLIAVGAALSAVLLVAWIDNHYRDLYQAQVQKARAQAEAMVCPQVPAR